MKTKMMMIGLMLAGNLNAMAQGIGKPLYFCAPGKYQMSYEQIQSKKDRLVILDFQNHIKAVGFGKLKNASSSLYSEKITRSSDQKVYVSPNGDKIEMTLDSDFGSKSTIAYFGGKKVFLQCLNPIELR